ncbi:MAG: BMP family ABC transporter substrate-binding protein [bacterium]
MSRRFLFSLFLILSFVLLSACGGQEAEEPAADDGDAGEVTTGEEAAEDEADDAAEDEADDAAEEAAEGDTPRVAMIIAQGGLGDRSYNDLAYEGLQRAAEELDVEVEAIESGDPVGEGEQLLRTAAEADFDLVLTLEFSHFDPLERVAPDYPDTLFGIVNIVVDQPNVVSVMFKEHEGSFLAGALAAMVTTMEDNPKVNPEPIIGAIGGTQSAGIDKFLVGYEEGAHYINPDVEVLTAYSESFGDPARGKELALAMYEDDADIVYQVAGGTGSGVFEAAEESERYAIGVDADQDYLAPGYILTSMIKRTDVAVEDVIRQLVEGELEGGVTLEYGLAENGVGLSPMEYTREEIPEDFLTEIEEIRAGIESGEIEVTDVTEE